MNQGGRRVVITGIGIVAPGNRDTAAFWESALAGKATAARIPEHWLLYFTPYSKLYAPLPAIDWPAYPISRTESMQLDMTAKLAIAAAWQAVRHAGFTPELRDEKKNTFTINNIDRNRSGVFLGTGMGGICSFAANEGHQLYFPLQKALKRDGREPAPEFPFVRCAPKFNPFAVSMSMPNGASAALGIKFSLNGTNRTIGGACAAGTMAIGGAFEAVRTGLLDLTLAGGVEYLADEYGGIFRAFDIARTLVTGCDKTEAANCPFDQKRSGFLFAEGGCAVLVLESLDRALSRGGTPIAEITAYAETFDAYSAMAMDPSAREIEAMLATLLAGAHLPAEAIDYINTHGTGTIANDEIEAGVIERMFGKRPAINTTKSLIGHTVGAAGAIEAAVTALSIRDQKIHGCANLTDPVRDLNFVVTARSLAVNHAVSQSFAFGGHNAALVLSKPD
ncbi:MAG: beta-ketoacyl-[acyl-carrier-protein] synthase family protein [Chitinispirillaceae bacterium]